MKIYKIKVNGKTYKVELEAMEETKGVKAPSLPNKQVATKPAAKPVSNGEGHDVLAPIQGLLLKIKVKVGDQVKKGQTLLIIEAMKLENEVCAPCDGVVSEIIAQQGNMVASKDLLLKIK